MRGHCWNQDVNASHCHRASRPQPLPSLKWLQHHRHAVIIETNSLSHAPERRRVGHCRGLLRLTPASA
eukprot:3011529-Pyramimonas_sp.AAC.1